MKTPIKGVWLSRSDIAGTYGHMFEGLETLRVLRPEEVTDPAEIRFALCWKPGQGAFAPYPNLGLAMSIAAGVDGLIDHPELPEGVMVARIRDPHQAAMMAGYVAHEVLRQVRGFPQMEANAAQGLWQEVAPTAPAETRVAVLGHGSMGREVARVLAALGFTLTVACRRAPEAPLDGVAYATGAAAVAQAAEGADVLVNVLPLTAGTRDVLNRALFDRLAPGAWLVQIGRGEHLVEADLEAALASGQLAGASLDVLRQEPLPADHPWWHDPRLRITPHIASNSVPAVVRDQVVETVTALQAGETPRLVIDPARGY